MTNLIEQLGGYEKAKDTQKQRALNGLLHDYDWELHSELFEYRRQHNIFEVGDKVVLLNWDNNSKIYSIRNVYEHKLYDGGQYSYSTFIYLLDGWSEERWFNNRKIRHATDEEIKAGKRLEVNQ